MTMTKDTARLNWTDKEWATYLERSESSIPVIRQEINYWFKGYVAKFVKSDHEDAQPHEDGKWHFCVQQRNDTENIRLRWSGPWVYADGYETPEQAIKAANEKYIPKMKLLAKFAKNKNFPVKAIQLLIPEKR